MIRGTHGILYSSDPDATRAALRDQFGLAHVDDGGGWLIFGTPSGGELGVHPASTGGGHELSFWCDDIDAEVTRLKNNGVAIEKPIWEEPWGRVAEATLPGGLTVLVYEPKHAQPDAG